MGLRAILAGSTDDSQYDPDDPAWMDVERLLKGRYIVNREEMERRRAARQRKQLYNCSGLDQAMSLIDEIFRDPDVRRTRREMAPYARFDNALRRIVGERARVYAKPVRTRSVSGAVDDRRYHQLQRRTHHDAAFRMADQWLALQNDVLVMFRVRMTPRGLEPRIDVVGPEDFFAVSDVNDPTKLVAVVLHQVPQSLRPRATDPHYLVWSDGESLHMDRHGRLIRSTIQRNPFGRIPGVLVHADYRSTCLLDSMTGEDAVAAHLANWLMNTQMLKASKSKSRQAAFTGETGRSVTGQTQDDEADLMLSDGVAVTTVDRGVELEPFMRAADHIVEHAAANYGIPPSVLRHAGATSGHEIDLRRIPLEEIREDRISIFRDAEREFAEIQSVVLSIDMPELSFATDGWHIDFAEVKRPQPEREKWETRRLKRSLGHSDPFLEVMEDNPDLSLEQAVEWVSSRISAYSMIVRELRALNASKDVTIEDAGQSPEDNGAMAHEPAVDDTEEPAA